MVNHHSIIFLDVDGPINTDVNVFTEKSLGNPTSSYYIRLPSDTMSELVRIIEATNSIVIMSSSWRLGWNKNGPSESFKNFNRQLMQYGHKVFGWTPYIDANRGIEIQEWLNFFYMHNKYYPSYIIIDDDGRDIIPYHKGHFVQVKSSVGITHEIADISIALMKRHQANDKICTLVNA